MSTLQDCSALQFTRSKYAERLLQAELKDTPRGLERLIVHPILQKLQNAHVQRILEIQEKVAVATTMSRAEKLEIYRYVSLRSSRVSRRFGRILGHLDAMDVERSLQTELANK